MGRITLSKLHIHGEWMGVNYRRRVKERDMTSPPTEGREEGPTAIEECRSGISHDLAMMRDVSQYD
jgi:hypothetical protein